MQDADNKDVSYERLLLPFGRGDTVEQIVGSYKSISIEGGFKINNLMGLRPKAVPVISVRAIIDRDFVPRAAEPARPTRSSNSTRLCARAASTPLPWRKYPA